LIYALCTPSAAGVDAVAAAAAKNTSQSSAELHEAGQGGMSDWRR